MYTVSEQLALLNCSYPGVEIASFFSQRQGTRQLRSGT